MTSFYGWGSTASRLWSIEGGGLLCTTKFPKIHGTHFINLGRMKTELTLELPNGFEHGTLGLGNQHPTPSFPKYCIEKKRTVQYVLQ